MAREKKEKKKGHIIGWILLFALFVVAGFLIKQGIPGIGHNTEIDTKVLKAEIVKIKELATYKDEYREIIKQDKEGFVSKRYYATYDGTIRAGVKMDNVEIEVIPADEASDKPNEVVVKMPQAEILDHTDDNWEVVYEDGYGNDLGKKRNSLIKAKKKEVEEKFVKDGGIDKAKEKAEEVIGNFIKTAYGEEVVVTFEDIK